ncbi:COP9 signalosome complex subunit 4 [Galdieria sulphuraria]|nr:COP9 signalosome complex subunit 4 [Galdieria sulphuraria]
MPTAHSREDKKKLNLYQNSLEKAIKGRDEKALYEWITLVTEEDITIHGVRQLISQFLQVSKELPLETQKSLLSLLLERTEARSLNSEELNIQVRETLSKLYETLGDFSSAARLLIQIPLEGSSRNTNDDYKVKTLIQIANLLFLSGDVSSAESYLNRASAGLAVTDRDDLKYAFKVCHTRILEAKGKFSEAAWHYYELSQRSLNPEVMETNAQYGYLDFLNHAVICAIVSPAGPQRSRILAALFRDDRTHSLISFEMLQAVYMDRLLRRPHRETFARLLNEYQFYPFQVDGKDIFEQSFMEHNLLAVSKIYSNIKLDQLGNLLQISSDEAESLAAKMIYEGRLMGTIDQVNRLVEFEHSVEIVQWDARLESFCQEVDHCYGRIMRITKIVPEQLIF